MAGEKVAKVNPLPPGHRGEKTAAATHPLSGHFSSDIPRVGGIRISVRIIMMSHFGRMDSNFAPFASNTFMAMGGSIAI